MADNNTGAHMVLFAGIYFARRIAKDNRMRAKHKAWDRAEKRAHEKALEESEQFTPLDSGAFVEDDPDKLWRSRQDRLSFLVNDMPGSSNLHGETDDYGPDAAKMISAIVAFQKDWNAFVGYMQKVNPGKVFPEPYTKIEVNGLVWDDAMEARVNKAYGKFVTQLDEDGMGGWYVDELGDTFYTWGDMIAEIKSRI